MFNLRFNWKGKEKNQTEKKNNSFYHNLNLKTILNKNFNSNLYRKNRIKIIAIEIYMSNLKNLFYSHSIVAGGFELMSYTTRFTPLTLFIISLEIFIKNSYGKCTQSAVIPSVDSTALSATTFS